MKKRGILLAMGVFLLIAGSAIAGGKMNISLLGNEVGVRNPSAEELNILERKELFAREFATGDLVASLADNDKAKMIMKFMYDSSYVGVPISEKGRPAVKIIQNLGSNGHYLCVVPLLPKDKELSKEWRNIYEKNDHTFFIPDDKRPQLVLKNNGKFSEIWRGLNVIHNGCYFLAAAAEAFDVKDPLTKRAMNELSAYDVEMRLVEKIGGPAYQSLLEKEVARLKKDYTEDQRVLLPDHEHYQESLENIFGKSKSNLEKSARGTTLWLNAIFRLFDESSGSKDEAVMCKIDFLCRLYSNNDIKH